MSNENCELRHSGSIVYIDFWPIYNADDLKQIKNDSFFKNGPFPASFSLFSSFQYSWQLTMFNKTSPMTGLNRGPLVSEATPLPTEPKPLPKMILSDWLKLVTWLATSNLNALFQSRVHYSEICSWHRLQAILGHNMCWNIIGTRVNMDRLSWELVKCKTNSFR